MKKELVFSGVQPTGNLHLGNYLGALKNFVLLQNSKNCLYCVVDLHAITTFQNPKELISSLLESELIPVISLPVSYDSGYPALDITTPIAALSSHLIS